MFDTSYRARLGRTLDAVAMRPTDKVPVSYNGPAYLAREMGMTAGAYTHDFPAALEATLGFLGKHPEIDSIHSPLNCPQNLSGLWLSKVKCPGEELPDDELWQVVEAETVTLEDYESLCREGYGPWSERVLRERLGDPMAKAKPYFDVYPQALRRLTEAGVPVMNTASIGSPFESLCGGRTLMNFFMDMIDEPELVHRALDAGQADAERRFARQLEQKPAFAWVGGWRAAPELLSHNTWMEFAWPGIRRLILMAVEAGTVPVLHFDSNWTRELETLRELPARKCILMLDGATDIRRAREVLDERMCLMGDTPASLLAFGSESEVYDYVTALIRDVGPKTGLIVSSGCDVPPNAKEENVAAMFRAARDWRA